jgi:hypothetical protein
MAEIAKQVMQSKILKIALLVVAILLFTSVGYGYYLYNQNVELQEEQVRSAATIRDISTELEKIQTEDPYKTNRELKKEIDDIQKTFAQAVTVYEDLLDLENPPKNLKNLDVLFADVLVLLGKRDYTTAGKNLVDLATKIQQEEARIAAAAVAAIPANVPENNAPPASTGQYSRQKVVTPDAGEFLVDIVAGDLSNTRVIVDTASTSTCANDCPVLPLATYASRRGAYAGINGSYFCPATYPTCAGKTNSFDLLAMNVDKVWFNSDNNVYSTNPGVVFEGSRANFVGAVSSVGRDTGIDSMLSNYPLLMHSGNVTFGGDDDPKKGSIGNRSFVSRKGNIVYIGVVRSATVAQAARVLKAMGMEDGLNLDNGGSTALWAGGYKVGPGRDLPNVILFVRK